MTYVRPLPLGDGRYSCPLNPGTPCRPFAGAKAFPVVDECGCPACMLWIGRHASGRCPD